MKFVFIDAKNLSDESLNTISRNLQFLENLKIDQNSKFTEEGKYILSYLYLAVFELVSKVKSIKVVIMDPLLRSNRVDHVLRLRR
jgi:hypothetical protein